MNKLIIIHIDGFSYDYIDNSATPFIKGLCQNGLSQRMAPSIFFQSNISSYTGKDTISHGRIVEYIYDPINSPFLAFKRFGHMLDSFDKAMPYTARKLWRYGLSWLYTTFSQKPPAKLHFIPFSISPCFNFSFNDMYIKGDDIFTKTRKAGLRTAWDDEDFAPNVKRRWMGTYFYRLYPEVMIKWAAGRLRQGIELIWVDLGAELDRCGHRYGPDRSRFSGALKKIDRDLEKMLTTARQYHYHFIVFSDHGMEAVKGVIDISKNLRARGLSNGKDCLAFYDSTLARFWAGDREVIQKIKTVCMNTKHGSCIEEKNSLDMGIPLNESTGQILFAAEQGYVILPNFYQGTKSVRGMHGYLEQKSGSLDGIFISDIDIGTRPDFSDRRVKVKDIAEFALKALGIK